jgi:AraC-like DNA-binding protein
MSNNKQCASQQTLEPVDQTTHTQAGKDFSKLAPNADDHLIFNKARTLMTNGLFKDSELDLDKMAALMEIQSKQLSNAIYSVSGKDFNLFVNEYRIKEAIHMFSYESELPINEVADSVGFNSNTDFSSTFIQITGISPRAYIDNLTPSAWEF